MRNTLVLVAAIALTSRAVFAQSARATPSSTSRTPTVAPPGAPFYPPGYVPPAAVPAPAPVAPMSDATRPLWAYPPYAHAPPAPPGFYYPRAVYTGDEASAAEERTDRPAARAARRPAPSRKHPGLFVGGAVLITTGTLALVTGPALAVSFANEEPIIDGPTPDKTAQYVGCAVLTGAGALHVAVGTVLMVIGGRRVQPAPATSGWTVGPRSMGWRAVF